MTALDSKIIDAMQQTFVGETIFSDEELAELFDKTSVLLRSYACGWGSTISYRHDEMMFVAMVNAVKLWDKSEETFWSCISRKLMGSEDSNKIYNYFTEVIDRLGKSNKILYLDGVQKRYYATILAHSFAPQKSIYSFLELCWQLYTKDLNFTYYSGDELYHLVSKELKQRFLKEKSIEDDFKLGSEVYSLKAGVKCLAIDAPNEMERFVDLTLSLIDKVFNGELLDSEKYYESIVKEWWNSKSKTFGQIHPQRKHSVTRAISDYSNIRPKYLFNGRNVVLSIPSIRLKNNFYDNPHILIFQKGELVDDQELLTFGSGLSMATKEKELYVDNLLTYDNTLDYELKIIHNRTEIYSSGASLNRQFILFGNHREILQNQCCPNNYMIYVPKLDALSSYPHNIKKKDYNLYVFAAEDGELVRGSYRTVFFSNEKQHRSIRIAADKKSNVKFLHNGEYYNVIDGDVRVFVDSNVDIRKYGVRYEKADFRLSDFEIEEHDGERSFLITQLLSVGEPQKISVFNYSTNQVESSFSVVKFNTINIEFDKAIYFDTYDTGQVRFKTEKYDKSKNFSIKNGDVIIPFPNGDIVITPPTLRWKIADMKDQTEFCNDLWYKTFSNSAELCINIPVNMRYQVILSNNTLLPECSLNRYRIGEAIYSNISNLDYITIMVKIYEVEIIPIAVIHIKETFRSLPFIIIDNQLFWDPKKAFIGDENALFTISITDGKKDVFQSSATLTPQKMLLGDIDIGRYMLFVDIIKRRAFTQTESLRLIEESVKFGNLEVIRFREKRIYIHKIMLIDESTPHEIQPFYIDHICFIQDDDGSLFYSGSIYILDRMGHKVYLNKMPDGQGNMTNMNPVRIELRTDNSCFIVAGYNRNDWDDFVGEFTLDTSHNRISNLQKGTKGIDYYIFEIEEDSKNV